MKNAVYTAVVGLVILFSQSLPASAKGPMIVPGAEAYQRESQLVREIPWYKSLPQAEAIAQKQGKMIFWVQMLGDMAGAT